MPIKDYTPFGEEWEKEMMKLTKRQLIKKLLIEVESNCQFISKADIIKAIKNTNGVR